MRWMMLLLPLLPLLLMAQGGGLWGTGAQAASALPPSDMDSIPPPGPPPLDPSRFFPGLVRGTFKGTWVAAHTNLTLASKHAAVLSKPQGVIFYQLMATPTTHKDVQYVQGEMVVREGEYVTSDDLHLMLEGVYVQSLGLLRVSMNSDLQEELSEAEVGESAGEYRKALRAAAAEAVRGRLPDNKWVAAVGGELLERGKTAAAGEQMLALALHKHCTFSMRGHLTDLDRVNAESSGAPSVATMIQFDGALESANCGVHLKVNTTSVQLQAYYTKAMNYTLMVTLLAFLQVVLLVKQMDYTNTQAGVAKVSLLTIGAQAIMDSYLSLLHLTLGIVMEQLFNAFATASFFQFVTFSLFEMRYMLTIWKARQSATLDSWSSLRRELSVLYSRFYGVLLVGLLIVYQAQWALRYLLVGFFSFWWPQIVRNAVHDVRRPLLPKYVLGSSAGRLLVPLYIYGCPKNFMRQAPDHPFCVALTLYVVIQVALLLIQHHFGPRCFLPARLFPAKYNYYRKTDAAVATHGRRRGDSEGRGGAGVEDVDLEAGGEDVDCVICMLEVHTAHARLRMVTPCNHFFHPECLQRWMDVKMECPTCRGALPPL